MVLLIVQSCYITFTGEMTKLLTDNVSEHQLQTDDATELEEKNKSDKSDDKVFMPYDEAVKKYGTGRYQILLFSKGLGSPNSQCRMESVTTRVWLQ